MTQIIMLIILAYIVSRIVRSPITARVVRRAMEFAGITAKSVKAKGGRGTAHAIVDGIFDGWGRAAVSAKKGSQQVGGKVKGLKPKDFAFNDGELTIFISRSEDLVIGRHPDGSFYAYSITASGVETELTSRALQRRIAYLQRKGKLSSEQERQLKAFFKRARN